jgi:predicted methyltransferase MtxX (methanogen marker protein 4)
VEGVGEAGEVVVAVRRDTGVTGEGLDVVELEVFEDVLWDGLVDGEEVDASAGHG